MAVLRLPTSSSVPAAPICGSIVSRLLTVDDFKLAVNPEGERGKGKGPLTRWDRSSAPLFGMPACSLKLP